MAEIFIFFCSPHWSAKRIGVIINAVNVDELRVRHALVLALILKMLFSLLQDLCFNTSEKKTEMDIHYFIIRTARSYQLIITAYFFSEQP